MELAKDKPIKQEKYIVHRKDQDVINNCGPNRYVSGFKQVSKEGALQKKYGKPGARENDENDDNLENASNLPAIFKSIQPVHIAMCGVR
ncbi:MAG TPA: hypothetical protein VK508_13710 [Cyclobacteriaceae bacterium]|nr:hypothetical protein [Cyclobacteriaceae bacterium]